MSSTSKTAKIIKKVILLSSTLTLGDVVVGDVTFLSFLLFSMFFFVSSLQNYMKMTIKSSKSKPDVEFPYDVRFFLIAEVVVFQLYIEIEEQQI